MATPIYLLHVLPRELRDMIYEEVLADGKVRIIIEQNFEKKGSVYHRQGISAPAITPPLLQTCRQIRMEASKMYYSRNVFGLLIDPDTMSMPIKWLRSIRPKYRRVLKDVHIHFSVDLRTDLPTFIHEDSIRNIPRWALDKQRQEMMQLVEDLSTMRHFKREAVTIQIGDLLACHQWCHGLIHDVQSLLRTYGISGRGTSCQYCGFGSDFQEESWYLDLQNGHEFYCSFCGPADTKKCIDSIAHQDIA